MKILTIAAVLLALPALAQTSHQNHGWPARGASPSTQAYQAANDRMHRDMGIAFSGNADRDFAAGMIPHHQGAIDMAEVVLKFGKDPELRKLATDIIKAQQIEIAFMKAWLAKQPK